MCSLQRWTWCFLGAPAVVYEGVMNPAILETYACREALVLGEDLLLTKMKISSDYMRVIKDQKAPKKMGDNCMIFKEIHARSSRISACENLAMKSHGD